MRQPEGKTRDWAALSRAYWGDRDLTGSSPCPDCSLCTAIVRARNDEIPPPLEKKKPGLVSPGCFLRAPLSASFLPWPHTTTTFS